MGEYMFKHTYVSNVIQSLLAGLLTFDPNNPRNIRQIKIEDFEADIQEWIKLSMSGTLIPDQPTQAMEALTYKLWDAILYLRIVGSLAGKVELPKP